MSRLIKISVTLPKNLPFRTRSRNLPPAGSRSVRERRVHRAICRPNDRTTLLALANDGGVLVSVSKVHDPAKAAVDLEMVDGLHNVLVPGSRRKDVISVGDNLVAAGNLSVIIFARLASIGRRVRRVRTRRAGWLSHGLCCCHVDVRIAGYRYVEDRFIVKDVAPVSMQEQAVLTKDDARFVRLENALEWAGFVVAGLRSCAIAAVRFCAGQHVGDVTVLVVVYKYMEVVVVVAWIVTVLFAGVTGYLAEQ